MTTYLKIAKLNNIYLRWSLLNMRQICQSKLKEDLRIALRTWQYVQFFVVMYLHSVWEIASQFVVTKSMGCGYEPLWGLGKGRRLNNLPRGAAGFSAQQHKLFCLTDSTPATSPSGLTVLSQLTPLTDKHRWFHVNDGKNRKGNSRKTFPARRHMLVKLVWLQRFREV